MKILRALQQHPADNFVALTYNLDLPFFEGALFEPLFRGGCRNVAVLCDPGQYQTSLRDIPALRHLGRGYVCLPSNSSRSAFHPKLMLLTSRDSGFLILGSANISSSGLTSNLETVTTFEYSEKDPDEHARLVFRWVFDYLSTLRARDGGSVLGERLDMLRRTTGWLRREPARLDEYFGDRGCWPLHNLDRPLLDQLLDLWAQHDGSRVEEAVVLSPYFDRAALALRGLLRRFEPEKLTLVTAPGASGMDPQLFRRTLDSSGTSWVGLSPQTGKRRLHAKALALRTDEGTWLLTGSPNFSSPALLRTAEQGNAELAVLRYETGNRLMERFLDSVVASAVPLDLDWEASLDDGERADPYAEGYRILSAELSGRSLSVVVDPSIPEHARLRVGLRGYEDYEFEPEHWTIEGKTVALEMPEKATSVLSAPASVEIKVSVEGAEVRSARMAIHDPEVIRESSQPVRYRSHARVPSTLISLETAQHLDLLAVLRDLLAMNTEQLHKRRGISTRAARELEREQAMDTQEEGYDPETMIVEETVLTPEIRTGVELYVDYDDRTLYQDIMSALRATLYSPVSQSGSTPRSRVRPDSGTVGDEGSVSEEQQNQAPGATDERTRQKVVKELTGLVDSFERGLQDPDFLLRVPAIPLKEWFYVLTTYLRLLRLDGLVDQESFVSLSERLFGALVGGRGASSWSLVSAAASSEALEHHETDTHYWKQAWLHLYLAANLCFTDHEEHLPEFAQLLRRAARQLVSPTSLLAMPEDLLHAVWRSSIYPDWKPRKAEEIVEDLAEYSSWYDENTLIRELRRSPLAYAYVHHELVQGRSVPTLTLVEPWRDDQLDYYWRVFVILCECPRFRKKARLVVDDANTLREGGNLDHRLMLFYRSDERKLAVQVNPVNGEMYRSVVEGLDSLEVNRLASFLAVMDHQNAVVFRGTKHRVEKPRG